MENNTELNSIKEEFLKKGYCKIPVNLIDEDFYYFLLENLKCNENKDLKNIFHTFRFDSNKLETRVIDENATFEELNLQKEELYSLYKNDNISQIWFMNTDVQNVANSLNINNLRNKLEIGFNKIVKFLYDLEEKDIVHPELQFSYYNKNCKFTAHTDGTYSGLLCSMILYLNENYNKENGGLLILNDELITPEFGICAIMDLTKHDIRHGVTEVLDGNGRFAILSFPKIK